MPWARQSASKEEQISQLRCKSRQSLREAQQIPPTRPVPSALNSAAKAASTWWFRGTQNLTAFLPCNYNPANCVQPCKGREWGHSFLDPSSNWLVPWSMRFDYSCNLFSPGQFLLDSSCVTISESFRPSHKNTPLIKPQLMLFYNCLIYLSTVCCIRFLDF